MSVYTSTRRKASQKYAKRLRRVRTVRQLSHNTAMSSSERIRRKYGERKKFETTGWSYL